jgi:hypothetical protein
MSDAKTAQQLVCDHCGALPDADGDHTCPCPHTDAECAQNWSLCFCHRLPGHHQWEPGGRCGWNNMDRPQPAADADYTERIIP